MDAESEQIVAVDRIEPKILVVRGQKVILDADLAALYGTTTKKLNQAAKRNQERFPADFMFQVTAEEAAILRSQIVTSSSGWGGRRFQPYVFTEHGALMAASVLSTQRAVEVSVFVVRAFVKIREILRPHRELARRLDDLERKVGEHDEALRAAVAALRHLMAPLEKPSRRIGFKGQTAARGGSHEILRAPRSPKGAS